MSNIEWTDATWNPVRGCSRVSQGCVNCYAERQAIRHAGPGGSYEGLVRTVNGHPTWTGLIQMVPEKLDEPLRWRKPRRVFVNSMSDLFHEHVPDEFIAAVWGVMSRSPTHTFQVLTKRPERARSWLQRCGDEGGMGWITHDGTAPAGAYDGTGVIVGADDRWPLPNVWLGVSVENQATADERIPLLLETPAAVRFVSYEPALGPVSFRWMAAWRRDDGSRTALLSDAVEGNVAASTNEYDGLRLIDWLIVGGESGSGARPCDVAWIRSAVEQCKEAGVACFVKQIGARVYDRNDRGFEGDLETYTVTGEWTDREAWPHTVTPDPDDGERCQGALCRVHLRDRKGGDMSEWPVDLRVREYPAGAQ